MTSAAEARVQKVLAAPDSKRIAELRTREWTGHNIPLSTTESTLGRHITLISDDERTMTIKRVVRQLMPRDRRLRVADMGALEGGLSFEMAREGHDVTGIEGRRANYEKADLIRSYFGLDNLHFEHRDVKTLSASTHEPWDVIICCGLLYHLDNPFAFLETLATLVRPGGMLFLETEIAPASISPIFKFELSDVQTLEHNGRTYSGRWFEEPQGGDVLERHWSAVSNARSFWPAHRDLVRGIYHAGFRSVMELFGMWEIDREFGLRDEFARVFFVCRHGWE